MTYTDALKILDLFLERDYTQGRPHLYIHSQKSNSWVRPKGMRIVTSSEEIAILELESGEWESIPFKEIDFGLW